LKNPVSGDVLKLTITDKDTSEPVVASVTIGEETKDSGIDGVVQFTREYGDYEATISAEGYTTATEELAFRSNHKNFEIELEAASSTGTVTVTCQDEDDTPFNGAWVVLSTDLQDPTTWIGMGVTDNNGTVTLETIDTTGEQPSPSGTVADIDFGTYSLYAEFERGDIFTYNGTLTVDGDEEVTITLTAP
jgi:hypothetical protein